MKALIGPFVKQIHYITVCVFLNMGQTRPRFVYFRHFLNTVTKCSTKCDFIKAYLDGLLGI